jgi:nucleotide-binding universal stress UspA family protein
MANRLGARLKVLTVIPEQREKSLVEVDSYVPQETLDQYHDDRAQRVKQHIEGQIAAFYAVRPDKDGQPISEITVHEGDDVAQLILDEAQAGPADLILMGSHPEGVLLGLLFGSVVQEVTRKTPVPLLLVPIDD